MEQTVVEIPQWVVGVAGTIVATLAAVVVYLFKRHDSRSSTTEALIAAKDLQISNERTTWATSLSAKDKQMIEDRAQWASQHAAQVADHKLQLERAEHRVSDERAKSHEYESKVRKECNELMERMAQEAQEAAREQVAVLQKIFDRIVGPPRDRDRIRRP